MDEKIDNARWLAEKFLSTEIHNCLLKHDARDFDYLQEHLRARAEIVFLRHQALISINADDGSRVGLDIYVGELKRHPKYASKFNQVPQISRADRGAVTANFQKIATGEIQVVDRVQADAHDTRLQ